MYCTDKYINFIRFIILTFIQGHSSGIIAIIISSEFTSKLNPAKLDS